MCHQPRFTTVIFQCITHPNPSLPSQRSHFKNFTKTIQTVRYEIYKNDNQLTKLVQCSNQYCPTILRLDTNRDIANNCCKKSVSGLKSS